jgi:hypothetical protein
MKVGAWYDVGANELRLRLRETTRSESRQAFLFLSFLLRYVPNAELRAMGKAIQATLEDTAKVGGGEVEAGG